MSRIIIFIVTAAAYFYFNWRYFVLVTNSLGLPCMRKWFVTGVYLINYVLFFLCSVLEMNLIFNWAVFFLFLFAETFAYSKDNWRSDMYLSLYGVLWGLVINIFCRCAIAVAISQPLVAFDNNVYSAGNLKALPVITGFVTGGIVFTLMAGQKHTEHIRTLLKHPEFLPFQLDLLGGLFLYLFLNLLLYESTQNSLLLKLWGIKSCLFSVVGAWLGMRYTMKMCELSDYRQENRAIQRELEKKEKEEKKLRDIAYRDTLTGAYNRQYALETVKSRIGQRVRFTLCFIDLDDLKGVNDRHGHSEGDRYLIAVARELERACRKDTDLLFRYGGDEFLLLFSEISVPMAEERIRMVNRRLSDLSRAFSFSMSVSCGAVDGESAEDAGELIGAADKKMYLRKRSRRERQEE